MYSDIYTLENSITIGRQQQRDLHNARCFFEMAIERCEDAKVAETLKKAMGYFTSAHAAIRQQENDRFETRFQHFREAQHQYGFSTVWSIFEVPRVEYEVTPELVDITHVKYYNQLVAVEKPEGQLRWVDLWRAADKAIAESGDKHHVFVEGFYQRKEDPIGTYQIITGS